MHTRDPFIAPLHRLMAFAQAVHVRRMIETIAVEPKQTFWIMTQNLLLESAAIEWSKVFGSWDEQTHWTRAFSRDDQERLRTELLHTLRLDAEGWETYRASIVDYRNQLIAHHDLNATVVAHPQFDLALTAAAFMFDQVRSKADQDWLGGIPTSLDRWARGIAANMTPIVEKSFAASAVLGSNVPRT
jgi:hypothetical protein